jgi:hypothetical protein
MYTCVSAVGLLVPEGIILPIVGISALTWLIRYIYYLHLLLLHSVINIDTKAQVLIRFLVPRNFPSLAFQTCRAHEIKYLRFHCNPSN